MCNLREYVSLTAYPCTSDKSFYVQVCRLSPGYQIKMTFFSLQDFLDYEVDSDEEWEEEEPGESLSHSEGVSFFHVPKRVCEICPLHKAQQQCCARESLALGMSDWHSGITRAKMELEVFYIQLSEDTSCIDPRVANCLTGWPHWVLKLHSGAAADLLRHES